MLDWLQNPFVVIALAVGAMFFGYFFGLFEGRGQGYKRRQEEEAREVDTGEPEAQVESLPPATPVLTPEENSMLAVSQDDFGELSVKLDGQQVERASINPEQRKRLITVLTLIRPWLETPTSAPQQPARPAPAQPTPAQHTPLRPIPKPQVIPAPSPRPAPQPVNQEEEEPVAAPGSIVGQIDSILHTQIAGTPLMERGIRLQESPEGGVIVWVGMTKYQSIEDVPDEQIRSAIRAAITTWENKYTPGL